MVNKNKQAFILLELLIILGILLTLLPIFVRFIFVQIKENRIQSEAWEKQEQIDFTQNYLQSILDRAISVTVEPEKMKVTTSENSYEVGLRKEALYIMQEAVRYLTTAPIAIKKIEFVPCNQKLLKLTIAENKKNYEFYLKLL